MVIGKNSRKIKSFSGIFLEFSKIFLDFKDMCQGKSNRVDPFRESESIPIYFYN